MNASLSWPFQDQVFSSQDFACTLEFFCAVMDHYLHMNGCSTVPLYQGKSARKYSCGISNIRRYGRSICSISIQLRSPRPSPKSIRDTLAVCWCGNGVELESAHILRDFICMGQCNCINFNYSDLRLPSDYTKTKANRGHVEGGRNTPPG